jgi:hypothetical protein
LCDASSLSSISSTSGRAVKLLCTPLFCTPENNRTDSTLGPNTQWCKWQCICQSLRVILY